MGQRPNREDAVTRVYQKIGEQRLVAAVLETFQLEGQLTGKPPVYTEKQLVDRTADLLTYMLEYLYDCGQGFEQAFETARAMLAHKVLGLPEPVVQTFKGGKRTDSAVHPRNKGRVTRVAMADPSMGTIPVEKNRVNADERLVVLTDAAGRILH